MSFDISTSPKLMQCNDQDMSSMKQFMRQDYFGGLHRPSSLLKNANMSLQRYLVNTSAIYFLVSTKWSSISFLLTSSLKK